MSSVTTLLLMVRSQRIFSVHSASFFLVYCRNLLPGGSCRHIPHTGALAIKCIIYQWCSFEIFMLVKKCKKLVYPWGRTYFFLMLQGMQFKFLCLKAIMDNIFYLAKSCWKNGSLKILSTGSSAFCFELCLDSIL